MNLRTSLRLSAVCPAVAALALALLATFRWLFGCITGSDTLDFRIAVLIAAAAAAVSFAAFLKSRRLTDRIALLDKWADSIAIGNMETRTGHTDSDDELSRHARTLERMLSRIQGAYAMLQREAVQNRQRAEAQEQRAAASRIGQEHLSEALTRLKDTQDRSIGEERLKALEQVVRGVTHDFGEALTPIMATTDLLLTCPGIADNKTAYFQHIRGIQEASEKARETIRQLAAFFRRVPVPQNDVDINQVVREAIEQVEANWNREEGNRSDGVTLRTDLHDLPTITGGEADLRAAMFHLICNAFEASPGSGTVTVSTRPHESGILVEVSDAGKGMTDAVRSRAEEPFFSTKGSLHKGMGLTIAAGTIRSHGGDIAIESRPGEGTRVRVSLPCPRSTASHATAAPSMGLRQMSVIVVDDDAATREVVALTITMIGHEVVAVDSAAECLTRMQTASFDIAIVDLAMPDMRGDELAARIAHSYPLTAVVMLTGFGEIMLEENNIPDHVDILVAKPISFGQLASVLEKAPALHRQNRLKHRPSPSSAPSESRAAPDPRAAPSFSWHG